MSVYYLVPTSFVGKKHMTYLINQTEAVGEFLQNLDHPFKKEIVMIREIILSVDPDITEEIKWAAPSFAYKGAGLLATFNMWEKKKVHLVFPNSEITRVRSSILEGNNEKRRMAYFTDMKEIATKKDELQMVIKELIELIKSTTP